MLHLHIIRYVESYDFKAEPDKPDSFSNNWKNNSLDDFILLNDDTEQAYPLCFRILLLKPSSST